MQSTNSHQSHCMCHLGEEKTESSVINELKIKIDYLSVKMENLLQENSDLRKKNYSILITAEQEEEYISNMLLRQIQRIKREKCDALDLAEKEEEFLTNMLTKKLQQLQKEKIQLENAMEAEQEYIVNKLQKQIECVGVKQRKCSLNDQLPPMLETLQKEIRLLDAKLAEREKKHRELINHLIVSKHEPLKTSDGCSLCKEISATMSNP